MSSGIEEIEAELNAGGIQESVGFWLWHCENFTRITKISQGLQKFRNHSEIFAIPTKFCYAQFFSMIAKFRYYSENSLS